MSRAANGPPRAWMLAFAAWVITAVATLAALFLGEIVGLPICALCWYQRILMFPLAVILPFALFPFDRRLLRPALALAMPGLLLAIYHQLLVAGVVPAAASPCRQGVPCSETVIVWFGFLTIPLLSILAFGAILALLGAAYLRSKP